MTPLCTHNVDDPRYPGGTRNLVGFLIEQGVPAADAYALPCSDVHTMAASLARSSYLARTERRLLLDEYPPPPAKSPPRVDWSTVLLVLVLAFSAVGWLLICSPIWRSFT